MVRIRQVGSSGALRKRLLEMGLRAGQTAYVVKYAPLRDPLELTLHGFHISLRVSEAALIEVDRLSQPQE